MTSNYPVYFRKWKIFHFLCQLREYCNYHGIRGVLSHVDDEKITLVCPINRSSSTLLRSKVEEFRMKVKKYDGVPFIDDANLEYTEEGDPEIDGYSLYDMIFRCLIDENDTPFAVMKHEDRYAVCCSETEYQFVFLDCRSWIPRTTFHLTKRILLRFSCLSLILVSYKSLVLNIWRI